MMDCCYRNVIKFGKESAIAIKIFDSELAYNKKYLKTKINFMREKSTQIFTVIKYQKKVLNVFVC